MKIWKRDFILSLCVLVFVAAALLYSYFLEAPRSTYFLARPDAYLAMWLIILGILASVLMRRALKTRSKDTENLPPVWCRLGVFSVAAMAVYLLLLGYLGFFLSSSLMLAAVIFFYSLNIGAKKKDFRDLRHVTLPVLAKSVIAAFAISFVTTRVFTDILQARLPEFALF